jgi:predicted PurR-regulated permease PerM
MPTARAERWGGRFPLGWALLVVTLAFVAVRTFDVLLVVFLAVTLAVYLDAVTDVLEKRLGMPSAVGLAVGTALSLGALAGTVVLIAPPVIDQVQDLLANLPSILATLDQRISALVRRLPFLRRSEAANPASLLASSLGEVFGLLRGALVPYLKGGVTLLIEGIAVVVMAVYLARTPALYTEGLVALVPPARRDLARSIVRDLGLTLRAWVVGQLIAMIVLAALTTLGLWIFGVPYFLAFGVFAGVAAIVPFFGTLLSTILPALFALGSGGVGLALAVIAVGVAVHLIEANLVSPMVMERQVNLPPVITIAGVLLIGKLFGLFGLLVAVPFLAVVMVLVRHILLGQVYGDPVSAAAPSGTVPVEAEPTVAARPPAPFPSGRRRA